MQVQQAIDNWRSAGQRMEQLGHEARHHRRWKSCQKGFRVRCSLHRYIKVDLASSQSKAVQHTHSESGSLKCGANAMHAIHLVCSPGA